MFMRMHRLFAATAILSLLLLLIAFSYTALIAQKAPPEPITVQIAFYPYTPDRRALFLELEQEFERKNPGVNIELVEYSILGGKKISLSEDYYSGGAERVEADIYEVDTILLSDLIHVNKLAPLQLPFKDFAPEAVDAVTRNGVVYAVPHWRCGNFLFYKKGDTQIANAKTWSELVKILKDRKEHLFVDFYGKSTLGEWYLTALSDHVGLEEAGRRSLASSKPDPLVVKSLTELLEACPKGFCRSKDLHENRVAYYARAFVRGESNVYIGYSESIHYGLQDAIHNCLPSSACLKPDEIAVRSLPPFTDEPLGKGLGWVDGLAINKKLSGRKLQVALEFIKFAVSDEGYKLILEPEWLEAPRYLLPARTGLNIKDAPLYAEFYNAHQGRETGKQKGLNDALRAVGSNLNSELRSN